MPTIYDDPSPLVSLPSGDPGRYTDNGLHYADVAGGRPAWRLVASYASAVGSVFHISRTDPELGVLPTAVEIDATLAEGQTIFVALPNEATEVYLVNDSEVPVLKNTLIGPRLYDAQPPVANFNVGERIEIFGQVDPDQDGVYTLIDTSGVGNGPNVWTQS